MVTKTTPMIIMTRNTHIGIIVLILSLSLERWWWRLSHTCDSLQLPGTNHSDGRISNVHRRSRNDRSKAGGAPQRGYIYSKVLHLFSLYGS